MSDRIFIRGIQVHAYHGVFEEEHRLGQKFLFDVDYWVEAQPYAQADDFSGAVSYADVHDVVIAVAKGPRINLIEALAERIAEQLLASFPTIEQVRVEVHKPGAPIAGVFSDVGVEILRRRSGA
ncbi:MAG: dihydroneopterin aldolase [Ancylobacter novellus]|uniref:7,8-dihydroneopterin aldolase n=1 Tax=Ancylobacter novellus TaxID=921 RepID=A0A2W5KDU7_ANCNO|nr:MAG: dihydroneopterin aldolase [Ancylobacter novellus]